MNVDLEDLYQSAREKVGEWHSVPVNPAVLLDLICVARAAKHVCEDTGDQYIDPSRLKKLAAALSDIEDSEHD